VCGVACVCVCATRVSVCAWRFAKGGGGKKGVGFGVLQPIIILGDSLFETRLFVAICVF